MTYQEFIDSILKSGREIPQNFRDKKSGYENHHIVPKCMGGSDNKGNLIRLTVAEHLMAHVLLFRENPNNKDLAYTVHMFSKRIGLDKMLEYVDDYDLFCELVKDVVKAREMHSLQQSEFAKAQWEDEEFRIAKSESSKKQWEDESFRDKMKIANKRIWEDEEYRALHSGENNPAKRPEVRSKISESLKELYSNKENHPMYKKHHNQESKNKISKAKKGKFIGGDNPHAKSVICVELNRVFLTIKEAADFCNYDISNFRKCLIGKQKTCRGYHWMYYDEYLAQ